MIAPPAERSEIDTVWQDVPIPPDAATLWSVCREARLFEDVDYGQWGLVLLDPESSARRTAEERQARSSEHKEDDIVIGEFLRDQELLVIAPSECGQRRILIALPLDARSDWFGVAVDLAQFLDAYISAAGQKYWETACT